MPILDCVSGHGDLVKLSPAQREQLCREIRSFLIENISKTGGHLASNLGVVELSVAIETVFDTASDRLVFDVGHQSYVHKILTGRRAQFDSLRQFGGIAGFPKPGESNTDAFVAGHASSSVSIALGMARARTLQKQDYHVVTVLGDGAATGGMAYEGLNDAADSREPMIVILNDNEMSIDRNVGGLSRHLSRLRTKHRYQGLKKRYRLFLSKVPGGKAIYAVTRKFKNRVKRFMLPSTIFENMGFSYFGPIDGHDLQELISVLTLCKQMHEPVLLHVLTQKGRGYTPAEENPAVFHGIGEFDVESGKTNPKNAATYSDAFGNALTLLASEDPRVCAITAAMPGGTGLLGFKNTHPDRLFDVGIAEEHAVSMAGGLAKQGMIPVVALYSTFLQRSFDQILQDISMLKLHVVLAVDRAGLVGDDGETHHGVFDVGFLRQVPNLTVLAPGSCEELARMLRWAVLEQDGPVAIRYPRGGDGNFLPESADLHTGASQIRAGRDTAIITYGPMCDIALEASAHLTQNGLNIGVIRLATLCPLPLDKLTELLKPYKNVLILEETAENSALYSHIAWSIPGKNYTAMNLGGEYVTHGKISQLREATHIDAASVAARISEVYYGEN